MIVEIMEFPDRVLELSVTALCVLEVRQLSGRPIHGQQEWFEIGAACFNELKARGVWIQSVMYVGRDGDAGPADAT